MQLEWGDACKYIGKGLTGVFDAAQEVVGMLNVQRYRGERLHATRVVSVEILLKSLEEFSYIAGIGLRAGPNERLLRCAVIDWGSSDCMQKKTTYERTTSRSRLVDKTGEIHVYACIQARVLPHVQCRRLGNRFCQETDLFRF